MPHAETADCKDHPCYPSDAQLLVIPLPAGYAFFDASQPPAIVSLITSQGHMLACATKGT
jgi:hypothetical protein